MTDNIDQASAGDIGNVAGAKVTEGKYPELRLVKALFFKSRKGIPARCFKAQLEVLGDTNGYKDGSIVEYFSKLEGNKHQSYDVEECARTKQFLGALFGYGSVAEIDANIRLSECLIRVASDAQPMTGSVVSAELVYKGIFSKWTFAPVFSTPGVLKVVRGHVGQVSAPVAQVAAPVFTAPAQLAPAVGQMLAPPPAPAAPMIPPGWAAHPNAPGWIYNTQNTAEMKQIA